MSTGWRVLTRADLKTFDDHQTKAVLYAMDHGGTGRMSSNGHCIIRNQQGETMSVSRSSGARRKHNTAADLCRLFGADVNDHTPKSTQPHNSDTSTGNAVQPKPITDEPTLDCPAKGCDAVFVTEGARYTHVNSQHYRCQAEGCDFVHRTSQGLAAHRGIVHEGRKPALGRKKKKQPRPVTSTRPLEAVPVGKPQRVLTDDQHAEVRAITTLAKVREVLGEDPRIAELQERVAQQQQTIDTLIRERDDAAAQLALIREALHLDAS